MILESNSNTYIGIISFIYQLLCFCSFLAKHKELLNLIHFHIYQPSDYFDILFTVDFLSLEYKIIVWKNTSRDIEDTLNQWIYYTVFLIRYFCISGCFITFDRSLWFESSVHYWITSFYCCSLPLVIWSYQILLSLLSELQRTEKPWHKITSKLHLRCACTCLYLFRSRKKLLVSFLLWSHKWYRNSSSSEISTASLLPVLRDESILMVSEFHL